MYCRDHFLIAMMMMCSLYSLYIAAENYMMCAFVETDDSIDIVYFSSNSICMGFAYTHPHIH